MKPWQDERRAYRPVRDETALSFTFNVFTPQLILSAEKPEYGEKAAQSESFCAKVDLR